MKNRPMPFAMAIAVFIVGILLGSIFTFGMQFWNESVERESCEIVNAEFISYEEIRRLDHPFEIKEIAIDCSNGQRYFIDGVSVNQKLVNTLSELSEHENVTLLIHPNSNTIVEFTAGNTVLLEFDDTMEKLGGEGTGFLFLGFFMYFCSLVGLYYTIWHSVRRKRSGVKRASIKAL